MFALLNKPNMSYLMAAIDCRTDPTEQGILYIHGADSHELIVTIRLSQRIGRARDRQKQMMLCWAMNGLPYGFIVEVYR